MLVDDKMVSIFLAFTSLCSACAAIASAYVAQKNRLELKEYHLAEKAENKRRELSEKYKSIILERRLFAIDDFYDGCCDLTNNLQYMLNNEVCIREAMQQFLSSHSEKMLQFQKDMLSFVEAIDKILEQSLAHDLEEFQDRISRLSESTFEKDDPEKPAPKYKISFFCDEINNLLQRQRIEIIRTIISYEPRLNK